MEYTYSKILPAKSRARRRRPATQAASSQAVHRNLATGPYMKKLKKLSFTKPHPLTQ